MNETKNPFSLVRAASINLRGRENRMLIHWRFLILGLAGVLGATASLAAPPPKVSLGPWHTTGPLAAKAFGESPVPGKGH